MRVIKQSLYCDRCKKNLDLADYSCSENVVLKSSEDEVAICETIDLCKDCTISFWRWMESGIEKGENEQ